METITATATAVPPHPMTREATKQAMSKFAIQHALNHFSALQMKNKTIAVYKELLP